MAMNAFLCLIVTTVLVARGEEDLTEKVENIQDSTLKENYLKRALDDLKTESRRSHDGSCWLTNGMKLNHGETKHFSCQHYRCENGRLNKLRGGCQDRRGTCYQVGQHYDDGCSKYRCQDSGVLQMVSEGCSWGNGQCKRVNEEWTSGCHNYRCHKTDFGSYSMYRKVQTLNGCQVEGSCVKPGETYNDERNCANYRCDRSQRGNTVNIQLTLLNAECKDSSGRCYRNNESWRQGCLENTCQTSGNRYWIRSKHEKQYDTSTPTSLPEEFEAWDYLAKNTAEFVAEKKLRDEVKKVPLLRYEDLTDHRHLRLAHLQLSIITAGYVWQEGDGGAAKRLPKNIAIPFYKISEALGMKPIISHVALVCVNYRLVDPSGPFTMENMKVLYEVPPGGITPQWFVRTQLGVEIAFIPAIKCILGCLESSEVNDEKELSRHLTELNTVTSSATKAMGRMHEYLTATSFYNEMRPFLSGWGGEDSPLPQGLIYEGISEKPIKMIGASAAQSAPIQAIDALLGVQHKPDKQDFLALMREYMTPTQKHFIEEVARRAKVNEIIKKSTRPDLLDAYNKCVEAVMRFRSYHIQLVTKYIVIMSNKIDRSKNFESVSKSGTGGTDLLPFLKDLRSSTRETLL